MPDPCDIPADVPNVLARPTTRKGVAPIVRTPRPAARAQGEMVGTATRAGYGPADAAVANSMDRDVREVAGRV